MATSPHIAGIDKVSGQGTYRGQKAWVLAALLGSLARASEHEHTVAEFFHF